MVEIATLRMREVYEKFLPPTVDMPSEGWLENFMKRNELQTKWSTPFSQDRYTKGTVGTISNWFEILHQSVDLTKYDERMIFNMDETMLIHRGKYLVVVPHGSTEAIVLDDEESDHITMVATISAGGYYLRPLYILKLKTLPLEVQESIRLGHCNVSGQKAGWMTATIYREWIKTFLEDVKIQRTIHNIPNEPAILFVDPHSSRNDPEDEKLLLDNNIKIVEFPSKTTHLLQACDLCLFGPFKREFRKEFRNLQKREIKFSGDYVPSKNGLRRTRTLLASQVAFQKVATYRNIQRAFQMSGIFPFDQNVVLSNPKINPSQEVTVKIQKEPTHARIIINEKVVGAKELKTKNTKPASNLGKRKSK